MEEEIFKDLANKYNKASAQIILRWHIDEVNIIILGSTNKKHIKDNAHIFDFSLTSDELDKIVKLNKNKRYYTPNPKLSASYVHYQINLDGQE